MQSTKPLQAQQGIVQGTRPGNHVNRPGLLPPECTQLTRLPGDQNDGGTERAGDPINYSKLRQNRFSAILRLLYIK